MAQGCPTHKGHHRASSTAARGVATTPSSILLCASLSALPFCWHDFALLVEKERRCSIMRRITCIKRHAPMATRGTIPLLHCCCGRWKVEGGRESFIVS